jgi:hypothetical protein
MAQEQARRLQEILDDPRKLDEYFREKAAREFEQGPVRTLDLAAVPSKGAADAPVRVVEYSDFLCPFCRSLAGAFANFLPQSNNRVAVYFKNYPLEQSCNPNLKVTIHAGACALALGGLCAGLGKVLAVPRQGMRGAAAEPVLKDVAGWAARRPDAAALEAHDVRQGPRLPGADHRGPRHGRRPPHRLHHLRRLCRASTISSRWWASRRGRAAAACHSPAPAP